MRRPNASAFRSRPSPMTETKTRIRTGRSLDHRHRPCHFARRRAGRQLGRAQRAAHQRRRDELRALHRAPLGAGQSRQPDSQEGRPAPDGSLAAHRHLCRRAGAGFRRRQGQQGNPGPDGHDRRRRRRRTRPRGGQQHSERRRQGQFRARLSQRTADERPAADAVPGAALQPAGRQYRHRPRRLAGPRAPSWARKPPASTRRGSRWRASPAGKATSR